jgi:hypothetical protein
MTAMTKKQGTKILDILSLYGAEIPTSDSQPKCSAYSWTSWRFSRFMQSKDLMRLFCFDYKWEHKTLINKRPNDAIKIVNSFE